MYGSAHRHSMRLTEQDDEKMLQLNLVFAAARVTVPSAHVR